MNSFLSIRRFLQLPKAFVRLLVICVTTVLVIDIFVGVLVYQNPVTPLVDGKNMLCVFLAGILIALSFFGCYHMALFLKHSWSYKWFIKNWQASLGLVTLTAVLSFLFTL